jgi:RNA polymerase sigma-70 factor (ECF subfamily)
VATLERYGAARVSAQRDSSKVTGVARQVQTRPVSEDDLVRRLLDRDEEAFVTLVDAWHSTMVRLARTFVPSDALAEEVAQETWAALLEGLDTFERRASLKTFVFSVLTNRAKTRGERERRSTPLSAMFVEEADGEDTTLADRFEADGHWSTPPASWGSESPEVLVERSEMMRLVGAAVDTLAPGQRAVFLLHDVEGLDSQSVCNALSISETNQRVLLHRARTKVRLALERHLGAGMTV